MPSGRRCHASSGQRRRVEILGLLSLIVWALTLTVTLKYVFFVTRADNNGEGGTLSLMALAPQDLHQSTGLDHRAGRARGSAVLWRCHHHAGHLGAVGGRGRASWWRRASTRWVVPITLVIIVGLFFVQRFGTAKVSSVFGPMTAIWFLVAGVFRPRPHHRLSGGAVGAQSRSRHRVSGHAFRHRLRRDRRDLPGGDRRRGALCRSRPFRPQADRAGLVRPGLSLPAAQLFRAGRLRAVEVGAQNRREPVLRDAAGMGAAALRRSSPPWRPSSPARR